jgi:Na+-driven multidrug efflux pump
VRGIFRFWTPLAATWLMMAAEGPILAAVIARLADPTIGLAAYGVAVAIAVLVESPILMLMSAATALVEDGEGYRRLRNFANVLNVMVTGAILFFVIPPVHDALFLDLLALPQEVADQAYGALWLFLPWPAAIGVRRFLQGIMIAAGRTRLVAYGTVIRLSAMVSAAIVFGPVMQLPGAWVGAASLSTGVVAEAIAARFMAHRSIQEILAVSRSAEGSANPPLGYGQIISFYYPLFLTSVLGLAVGPMVTFFMGRSVAPVQSLAVFPVVHSLLFIFRALGLSFQDASIALLGRGRDGFAELSRFAWGMGLTITAVLCAIAFTPLADFWYQTVSGLSPELAAYTVLSTRIMVLLPLAGVWLSLERGVLMRNRRTRPITYATALEVAVIAGLFAILGWGVGVVGVTAAFIALSAGKFASTTFLIPATRRALREGPPLDGGNK